MKPDFDEVWARIAAYQGKVFRTKRYEEFTYHVVGNTIFFSKEAFILKSQLKVAYDIAPVDNVTDIPKRVPARSYAWGLLHDPRILPWQWSTQRREDSCCHHL